MSGRDTFTNEEAITIREHLGRLRLADRDEQKSIRARLRRLGFRISDYATDNDGFTVSDFDMLVARGVIICTSLSVLPGNPVDAPTAPSPRGCQKTRPVCPESRTSTAAGATADVILALTSPRRTIAECMAGAVPDQPGLYAIYGNSSVWRTLGLSDRPDDRPLYVGKAEDSLVTRDLKTHFATGATGRSSPRRSFAALLAHDLDLHAIPRRPANPEPGKWTHYALEIEGDQRLTNWMNEHLLLAVWPLSGERALATVESEVMAHWEPPLNLIGVRQPWSAQVKAARGLMAGGAKAWARNKSPDPFAGS
jgi:hypothetical protein